MYGTPDAARCWDKAVRSFFESLGLVTSKCSSCVWYAKDSFGLGELRSMCHGNDIISGGSGAALKLFKEKLEAELQISFKGILSGDTVQFGRAIHFAFWVSM